MGIRPCGAQQTGGERFAAMWRLFDRMADKAPVRGYPHASVFLPPNRQEKSPGSTGGWQIGENVQFAVRTSRLPKIRRRKARFGQGTNMPPATNTKHLRRLPQPVTKVRSAFPLPLHRACGIPLPYNDSRLQAGCPAGFLRRHTGRPPPGHDAALGGIPRRCAALPVH